MTPAFKVRPPLTDSLLPPSQPIATFHHGDAQARHEDDSLKGNKLLSPPRHSASPSGWTRCGRMGQERIHRYRAIREDAEIVVQRRTRHPRNIST